LLRLLSAQQENEIVKHLVEMFNGVTLGFWRRCRLQFNLGCRQFNPQKLEDVFVHGHLTTPRDGRGAVIRTRMGRPRPQGKESPFDPFLCRLRFGSRK
jgi:hypothetical protein